MRCKVINRTILALRSTTKEEQVVEALEVMDKSIATIVDNRDTTQETIPTPPQYVSIASPMIVLLKNVLFCKISGRKRDHRWETRTSN